MRQKILLVDDQRSIREKLRLLFESDPDFQVVGVAENGAEAIERAKDLQPDVVLMDLEMPILGGVEASKILRNQFPDTRILMLTSIEDAGYLKQVDSSIVEEIIFKGSAEPELLKAIKKGIPNKKFNILSFLSLKRYSRLLVLLSPMLIIALLLGNSFFEKSTETNFATANQSQDLVNDLVIAPGILIPKGEVIKLSVANAEDSRVNKILVEEGDRVEEGQVIAILQGFENRQRDLEEAQNAVSYYKAKLKQIKAGNTEQTDLKIQETEVTSALAQFKQAEITYNRNQNLFVQGAVSQQTFDETKETLDIAKAVLDREKQNLARISETTPADIEMANIELKGAMIAVEQRKADLKDTQVRVPVSGQILRINTRVGEQVNTSQGIVELGRTDEMYAIAEVYETDINKVKIGQLAIISSEYGGFEGKLKGTVEHLGLKIGPKKISYTSQDPTQDENSRIVEVKVRIDPEDSKRVAGLTHMKVRIQIGN